MKNETNAESNLIAFLKFYTEQNAGCPTRLGVFENGNDYWIEDGIPLGGIVFDKHDESIEIMFSDVMTHTVKNVKKVKISFSLTGINDGLDITDAEGKTTILRFEN